MSKLDQSHRHYHLWPPLSQQPLVWEFCDWTLSIRLFKRKILRYHPTQYHQKCAWATRSHQFSSILLCTLPESREVLKTLVTVTTFLSVYLYHGMERNYRILAKSQIKFKSITFCINLNVKMMIWCLSMLITGTSKTWNIV